MLEIIAIGAGIWAMWKMKKENEQDETNRIYRDHALRCNKCNSMVQPRTLNTGRTYIYDCQCGHTFSRKF